MTISEALAALRAIDLPTPRRQYLAAKILENPASAESIVTAATAESERNARHLAEWTRAEHAQRAAYALRNPLSDALTPTEASGEGGRSWVRPDAPVPPERPVVITWTTPTKPDARRPERKPEQDAGLERNRAQRAEDEPKRERASGWRHGTIYGYQKRHCRCVACVEVFRARKHEYQLRYRERKNVAKNFKMNDDS